MVVVGAVIINPKGDILLQKRDKDAPTYQLHWTLFGGAVESDETPEQAIRRELREEIGLTTSQIGSLRRIQENIQHNGTTQIIFELATNASLSDLELKEGDSMDFIPQNQLFRRKFAFNIKDVLLTYVAKH